MRKTPALVRTVLAEHGLPVRVHTLEQQSSRPSEYEVTELVAIQEESVSAQLFTIPDGLEKTTPRQTLKDALPGLQDQ